MNTVKKKRAEQKLGDKMLKSAKQARDWVNGKPGRVRVTYVVVERASRRD